MKIPKYLPSSYKSSNKDIINAGTCNDNIKIIPLDKKYNNPKFYPRKFEKWEDEFSVILLEDNSIKVRRTDVQVGGWGETLLIDVEYENDNNIEQLSNQKIPRVIFQTFETNDIPQGMNDAINSWINLNPEYEYCFFDEIDRINFIKYYFDENVLDAYLRLIPGAFKADLWRCCVLYEKGGVYIDTDMICLKSLNEVIEEQDDFIITRDDPMSKTFLANGFIASIPKHPFLKQQIDNIVDNVLNLRETYYLNISGPALFGKSVNEVLNRYPYEEFNLGSFNINNYNIKILEHDWTTKSFKYNNIPILITEYNNKNDEMNEINNPSFYSLVQNKIIYQSIPRNIYYTSLDYLGINTYMYDSFTEKNKLWKLNHFVDSDCDLFFKKHGSELQQLLGVNVESFYFSLTNGGEKSDFWRYCIIYLFGGVYVDADIYCNVELDKWVKHHDLILGVEANLPINEAKTFGMDNIGFQYGDNIISICNWAFAAKARHEFIKNLIIDICNNPISNNVLLNTGPGRLSKNIKEYFNDVDFSLLKSNDIVKDLSIIYSINRFGSNQSHSNSIKNYQNPILIDSNDVYLIHLFEGSWRRIRNKPIKTFKSQLGISHNLSIIKNENGYIGLSRLDKDTSRTLFMKQIGDCRSLVEYNLDENFNLISEIEKNIIGYNKIAKFEDFRFFNFNNKQYSSVSYIDEDFNTKVALLDNNYNFLGNIKIDNYNSVSWNGVKKIWEKNWLFFEKDNELYFIYSTTPNYIVYKCINFETLEFTQYINISWPLTSNVPEDEYYFTFHVGSDIKIATGGSSNPILLKDKNMYLYFIHTKFYNERKYNHYAVLLDLDLNPIKLISEPVIKKYVPYGLLFISSVIETNDYLVFTGGIEDNTNFIWELSKDHIFKLLDI